MTNRPLGDADLLAICGGYQLSGPDGSVCGEDYCQLQDGSRITYAGRLPNGNRAEWRAFDPDGNLVAFGSNRGGAARRKRRG
jgi:hypothetical protein